MAEEDQVTPLPGMPGKSEDNKIRKVEFVVSLEVDSLSGEQAIVEAGRFIKRVRDPLPPALDVSEYNKTLMMLLKQHNVKVSSPKIVE